MMKELPSLTDVVLSEPESALRGLGSNSGTNSVFRLCHGCKKFRPNSSVLTEIPVVLCPNQLLTPNKTLKIQSNLSKIHCPLVKLQHFDIYFSFALSRSQFYGTKPICPKSQILGFKSNTLSSVK